MNDQSKKLPLPIIVALIGVFGGCMAAAIGLGQPIIAKLADIYFPSPTATPIVQTTVNVEGVSLRSLLFDNFDKGSDFSHGFNPDIWRCADCSSGEITNEAGVLRIKNGNTLYSQNTWASTEIQYVQWKMKGIEAGQNGSDTHLGLSIDLSPKSWLAYCWIESTAGVSTGLLYNCSVAMWESDKTEIYSYYADSVRVNLGEWYTSKIELDKSSLAVRFYIDNKQVGYFLPQNGDELRGKQTRVEFGVYGGGNMISDIDDVLVVQTDK